MASADLWPDLWGTADRRSIDEKPYITLLGDENFLILVFPVGLVAWSFDSNIQMVNEDVRWTEIRTGNLKNLYQNERSMSASGARY